jgi:hypothetical protein
MDNNFSGHKGIKKIMLILQEEGGASLPNRQ